MRTVIALHHYNDNTTHFRSIQRIVLKSICVYAYAKLKQQSSFDNKPQVFLAHIAYAVNGQTNQIVNRNGKSTWTKYESTWINISKTLIFYDWTNIINKNIIQRSVRQPWNMILIMDLETPKNRIIVCLYVLVNLNAPKLKIYNSTKL